jgi:alpha-amylase
MITQDDVIYFVLTDRFRNGDRGNDRDCDPSDPKAYHGGDFAGLRERLPYLVDLGVTAVWITPVYLSIGKHGDSAGYHGYWALDFERVDPHLYTAQPGRAGGSREYLKDLVDAIHARKLKVVLDMVINHTGYHNETYRTYPHKKVQDDWFNRGGTGPVKEELAGLPDLNHDRIDVVDYFVNDVLTWIDAAGIDGIRMDTVKHVEDAFWYFFKSYVKAARPGVTLIGEVLSYDPGALGRYQQEHDFDTVFDFPLCGQILGSLVWDQPMTLIARPRLHDGEPRGVLDNERPYSNANRLVTLLDNHDLERRITTEILDRWGHWDRDRARRILKLCLSFLLTTRGIPQIYYGTEIGLEGRKDPDNRRDMPWSIFGPNHAPTTTHPFERDVHEHTRSLLALRRRHEALRHGSLLTLYVDHFLYAYLREFRGDVVIVALNNGLEPMPVPLEIHVGANSNVPPRVKQLLEGRTLASQTAGLPDLVVGNGRVAVQLPGKTAGVYALPSH